MSKHMSGWFGGALEGALDNHACAEVGIKENSTSLWSFRTGKCLSSSILHSGFLCSSGMYQNASSTFKEWSSTFILQDLWECIERALIFDSFAWDHHHPSTRCIYWVISQSCTYCDSLSQHETSQETIPSRQALAHSTSPHLCTSGHNACHPVCEAAQSLVQDISLFRQEACTIDVGRAKLGTPPSHDIPILEHLPRPESAPQGKIFHKNHQK